MKTSNLYPPTSDPRPPMVSVVVTTKNEERNIEHCMKSIKLQSYENIEIIVVDNFSADKTKEIALKYTNKVYDKGPERSAQRNFGMIDVSNGKYVMFVDADMILSPCLVESCVKEMEEDCPPLASSFQLLTPNPQPVTQNPELKTKHSQPRTRNLQPSTQNSTPNTLPLAISHQPVVALHIPEIVLGKKFFSKVRRFERSFYDGTVIDGARFFLKEAFIKVGGFDESMSGPEDWDIDKKIKQIGNIGLLDRTGVNCNSPDWELYGFIKERGTNPKYCGTVIYHNEVAFDIKKYLQKKIYYAGSFSTYINKWGQNDPEIRKQFGMWYRYFTVFLENGKWKQLISHPLLTLGMCYLRFMVGIKFFMYKSKNALNLAKYCFI